MIGAWVVYTGLSNVFASRMMTARTLRRAGRDTKYPLPVEEIAPGRRPGGRGPTMYGPYGPMMAGWDLMWSWMWPMQLVWVVLLVIFVALVAYGLGTRAGSPKTPPTPNAG